MRDQPSPGVALEAADRSPADPPAVILSGMHRSGTSLAASLLADAGFLMGNRLLGPARGNELGHFEDLDFYELHQRMLMANGLGTEGFTPLDTIVVPPGLATDAQTLVARRRSAGVPWGWKDPRTVLFLDFWRVFVPEARFVFVLRRPWEVVDSLFRRGDGAFTINPELAVGTWMNYNRRLLQFVQAHADRCLLREITQVVADPGGFLSAVGGLTGFAVPPPSARYEHGLLQEDLSPQRAAFLHACFPDAHALYLELRELAGSTSPLPASPGPGWRPEDALRDWARASRLQQEARGLAAALAEACSRADQAEAVVIELRSIRLEAIAARTNEGAALRASIDDLEAARGRLLSAVHRLDLNRERMRAELSKLPFSDNSRSIPPTIGSGKQPTMKRIHREIHRLVRQTMGITHRLLDAVPFQGGERPSASRSRPVSRPRRPDAAAA
jgi:hypothetical protein